MELNYFIKFLILWYNIIIKLIIIKQELVDIENRLNEAKRLSNDIIKLTNKAIKRLNSAGRWGLIDIIGGGKVTSAVKRHKIGKYRDFLEEIERETRKLNGHLILLNIRGPRGPLSVNTGILGHLIDIFADNFILDIFVQRDISKTKKQLKSFKKEIQSIQKQLNKL